MILADAINLGLTKMAEICPGTSFNKLARERMRHRSVGNDENEPVQNTRLSPDQSLKQTTCGSSRRNLNLRRSRLLTMHNQRALLRFDDVSCRSRLPTLFFLIGDRYKDFASFPFSPLQNSALFQMECHGLIKRHAVVFSIPHFAVAPILSRCRAVRC